MMYATSYLFTIEASRIFHVSKRLKDKCSDALTFTKKSCLNMF